MTGKKGAIIVDAAIILPIFLVALLTLACFSRLMAEEEQMLNDLLETGERMAAAAWFSDGEGDSLIPLTDISRGEIPLPLDFPKASALQAKILVRGFTGAPARNDPAGFDVFGESNRCFLVYVFPRAGERFHVRDCAVIEVGAEEMILTDSLRRKYAPCSHCQPESLLAGNRVYCFPKEGETYHRKSCYLVDRYISEMTALEAVNQGYSPCLVCGGGLQ